MAYNIWRLAIFGVVITQEDLNSKFLKSLPLEWITHVVVWMNKAYIETMSIDDLYNKFKIVEQDVKKSVGASNGAQNLAFMTALITSISTVNFSDNTMYAFMVENLNGSNLLQHDLEQIHEDDLEAMDLKWQLSLLSMRAKRYFERIGKKIFINANDTVGYDKSKQGNNEDTSSKAMLAKDGVGFDWSDMAEEQVQTNMALMAFSDSEVYNDKTCTKTCLKNYETLKKQCDDLIVKLNQTEFTAATYKRGLAIVEEQLITYRKNEVLFSEEVAVLKREVACKDYEINVLKSKFEKVKQEKEGIEFKIKKFDNASKSLNKLLESQITDKSKKGLGYNDVPPPHPLIYNQPKKLDLSYSGLDEFKDPEFKSYGSEDKQVSEDTSSFVESSLNVDKETVFLVDKKIEFVKPKNHEKPVKKSVRYAEMYRSQSPRGNQRNWNGQKSNQLGSDFVMYNKACFICGSFDHVQAHCKYHQRERMVYGNNYNRVNYNYTTNRTHPNAQRNMVPRAVLMKTSLKPFNTARTVNTAHPKSIVFSAKPMSPKAKVANTARPKVVNTARPHLAVVNVVRVNQANAVKASACWGKPQQDDTRFIDSGCSRHMTRNIAYLSDFKEFDEILLKIPRKDNMYSFDMKNIVPKESLTCLVAKDTSDESMLWHRRLGHINFKNINKLVKDNLVRGLPTKRFENDQTYVACLKGKQHKASLVTDDYSRLTWVFFLTTKDETSKILKNFIKEIENLVDKKVKITRSDNGTKFKNKVIDDFYREKGIKREYSVAKTPQQNGVAERRNRTLIEVSRTMLADSKLPTTFWAKAVSTACYVQNRVLVVKPHNKTPYELFRGLKPALSFMRPFGCHVTILNTLDNLGKFDGKSDEGFFVGYSLSSKAFRVHKENLMQDVGNGEPKFATDDQKQVEDGPHNESDEKDKSEDDSSPKKVNVDGQHVNTTTLNVEFFSDEDEPEVDLEKPLVKDGDADNVDVHLYRSMIGSLMYLTALGQILCLQYLKGKPTLGLWYSRDSPFELVAYTDSNYTGATQDRKSTTGG
ncbi:putative ribonuclease H-like domain-containing protein [Tanacetum coccineum]